MHTSIKELLVLHKRKNILYLTFKRFLHVTVAYFDERYFEKDDQSKGKVTVLKRKFDNNKQTSTIIEWKSAADVIKKLNLENKYLFGPVQNSKNSFLDNLKNSNFNEIIQHETKIPLIESAIDNNDLAKNVTDKNLDLQSILMFPLLNKYVHSTQKINEVNHLRKQLEYLCEKYSIPSVSTILQQTMPKDRIEILDRWKQKMINQLGKEGFEKYQEELFANGASLHHSISDFLSSVPESELHIKKENIGHWMSLKHTFPYITEIKLLEEMVMHPFLCYRGIIDCFAKYKENLVVIDWKTSKKRKPLIKNTYDDPLQIAAYAGALNFDPKFQYLASKGLIVIAYEDGNSASVHFIDESDMKFYWNEWLKRVKQFWELKKAEIENS